MPRMKKSGQVSPVAEIIKRYDIPAIQLAKSIIEKDPVRHIHISALADKAGINEFKLKIGFRLLYHISPYQYRLRLCLEKAKELLEETDDTIHQIAVKVGFDTYNGFSTAFKKAFRIAPTEYRHHRGRNASHPMLNPF